MVLHHAVGDLIVTNILRLSFAFPSLFPRLSLVLCGFDSYTRLATELSMPASPKVALTWQVACIKLLATDQVANEDQVVDRSRDRQKESCMQKVDDKTSIVAVPITKDSNKGLVFKDNLSEN